VRTTRFEPAPCPSCGKSLDAATHPTEDLTPEPGDFTICLGCQDLFVFTDELELRAPTTEELGQVPLLETSRFQALITEAKRKTPVS